MQIKQLQKGDTLQITEFIFASKPKDATYNKRKEKIVAR